jgi:chemotaxis protein MotA
MADDEIRIAPIRHSPDLATILGLIGAFGLIAYAIYIGGSFAAFVDVPAILIVIGGTIAATTVCFSLGEIRRTTTVVATTIFHTIREPAHAAVHVLQLAQMARKHGLLSLQDVLETLRHEPFLQKGIAMVVDGVPGDEVEAILRRDMIATSQRHAKSASVLRRASELSPAMGLIGTLIGLVQMLSNLDDPSTIGPSMAVALLTTFYGAVMANMILVPLAAKLERNSQLEETVNHIYVLGVASIGRQENPRRLEMLVNSIMPPANRIRFFD